jgi:N-methylhydantoinase A/oxoprolinase/acetone carboxylase beta subunit
MQTGRDWTPETVAEGFLRVAVDNMANAIKTVSIQRGHDPADFTLCCFGGAGGQHACRVADALGIREVWCTRWPACCRLTVSASRPYASMHSARSDCRWRTRSAMH